MLVGHSLGGAVLTNVPADAGDVQALVDVAGHALNPGESCADATGLAPGSTLVPVLTGVPPSDGGADVHIDRRGPTISSPPTCPSRRRPPWRSPGVR